MLMFGEVSPVAPLQQKKEEEEETSPLITLALWWLLFVGRILDLGYHLAHLVVAGYFWTTPCELTGDLPPSFRGFPQLYLLVQGIMMLLCNIYWWLVRVLPPSTATQSNQRLPRTMVVVRILLETLFGVFCLTWLTIGSSWVYTIEHDSCPPNLRWYAWAVITITWCFNIPMLIFATFCQCYIWLGAHSPYHHLFMPHLP